jgi:catechol 2,3-dioxygenase-like lactoylglutathione lyase family enzyme
MEPSCEFVPPIVQREEALPHATSIAMPPVVADHRSAPVNALGYLRVMFAVENIDDTLVRLGKRGAKLVGEVVQYEDMYRLCYIRGPEGILIGLAHSSDSRLPERTP